MMLKVVFALWIFAAYCGVQGKLQSSTFHNDNINGILQESHTIKVAKLALLVPEIGETTTTSFSAKDQLESRQKFKHIPVTYIFNLKNLQFFYNQYLVQWINALVLSNHLNIIYPFSSFW